MGISRRELLRAGGAAAAAAGLPAWTTGSGALAARPNVRWEVDYAAPMPAPSVAQLLLSRTTWGTSPEDARRAAAIGLDAWIEEQLDPAAIDDSDVEGKLAALPSLAWDAKTLLANYRQPYARELRRAMLFRAVHSRRQLYEVMVGFWTDHFSIFQLHRNEITTPLKSIDDRVVVRQNALGTFRQLLDASMHSGAMLSYLDNHNNKKGSPNENYGRELLELHTLGVDGGYTEADVKAAARVLTGWSVDGGGDRGGGRTWEFIFKPENHEPGAKTVLGRRIPEGGEDEGLALRDLLLEHPSTPRYIALKLVRRFVSDLPPTSLVDRVAAAWGQDGDIRAMLRVLLRSPEFAASPTRADGRPSKVRRPLEGWVAAIRAVGGDATPLLGAPVPNEHEPLQMGGAYSAPPFGLQEGEAALSLDPAALDGHLPPGRFPAERFLELMGHVPYAWPFPDGYPDRAEPWVNALILMVRWNLGLALAEGRVDGISVDLMGQMALASRPAETVGQIVDFWIDRALARPVTTGDRGLLVDFLSHGGTEDDRLSRRILDARLPGLVALLLDSPYFLTR